MTDAWGNPDSGGSASPDKPQHHGLSRIWHDIADPVQRLWTGFERSNKGVQGNLRLMTSPATYEGLGGSLVDAYHEARSWVGLEPGKPASEKTPDDRAHSLSEPYFGLPGAARHLGEDPIWSWVPGTMVAGKLTSPEGRKWIGENPVLTLLDVAPFLTKVLGGAFGEAAGKEAGVAATASKFGATAEQAASIAKATEKRVTKKPYRYAAQQLSKKAGAWAEEHPSQRPLSVSHAITWLQTGKKRDFIQKGNLFQQRAGEQITQWLQGLHTASKMYEDSGISLERQTQLAELARMGDPGLLASLKPEEAAFIHRLDAHAKQFQEIGFEEGTLHEYQGETYSTEQMRQIRRGLRRSKEYYQRAARIRERLAIDPHEVFQDAPSSEMGLGGLSGEARALMLDQMAKESREMAARYETMPDRVGPGGRDIEVYLQDAERWEKEAAQVRKGSAIAPYKELLKVPGDRARYYRDAMKLQMQIESAVWNERGKTFIKDLEAQQGKVLQDLANVEQAQGLSDVLRTQLKSQFKLRTEVGRLGKRAQKFAEDTQRITPATWISHPLIQESISDAIRKIGREKFPQPEAWAQLDKYVLEGNYEALRADGWFTQAELNLIAKDQAVMWVGLKEAGYEPHFIHNMGESAAEKTLIKTRIRPDMLRKTSDVLDRTWYGPPYEKRPWVAIAAQGVEHINRENTKALLAEYERMGWTMNRDSLVKKIQPYLNKLTEAKRAKGETVHMPTLQEDLIARDHLPFDPTQFFPTRQLGKAFPKGEQMWIPKQLYETLGSIQKSMSLNAFQKTAEFGNKVYAHSILKFSPRFYVHVAISSQVALLARESPLVYREAVNAWKLIHDGNLDGLLPSGGFVTREEAANALYNVASGTTMGRLLGKVDRSLGKYSVLMHDMTQAMAYLAENKKMLHDLQAAGMDIRTDLAKEVARDTAVEIARRVVPQWDRLLPIERTIMRYGFNFYNFSSFITRYLLSYPFDHPMRAYIIGHLATKEQEDWDTGIPAQFQSMLFLGKPDASGKQMAVPFTSAMPFLSVSNIFTSAGIYARLNPGIQAFLQWKFGINPNTGQPDLFPGLTLDDKGNFTYQHKVNLPQALGEQYLPQFAGIEQLAGWSADFKALKETDPELWRSQLYGNLGLVYPEKLDFKAIQAKKLSHKQYVEYLQMKADRRAARRAAGAYSGSDSTDEWGNPK